MTSKGMEGGVPINVRSGMRVGVADGPEVEVGAGVNVEVEVGSGVSVAVGVAVGAKRKASNVLHPNAPNPRMSKSIISTSHQRPERSGDPERNAVEPKDCRVVEGCDSKPDSIKETHPSTAPRCPSAIAQDARGSAQGAYVMHCFFHSRRGRRSRSRIGGCSRSRYRNALGARAVVIDRTPGLVMRSQWLFV